MRSTYWEEEEDDSRTPRERRKWVKEEDIKLQQLVTKYGTKNWRIIASHLSQREPKQCRERWMNHLDPGVVKGRLTEKEWQILLRAHEEFGNRWTEIAKMLPGRTPNHIKNHWHARMRKGRKRQRSPTSGLFIMESDSDSEDDGMGPSKKRRMGEFSHSQIDEDVDSQEDDYSARFSYSEERDDSRETDPVSTPSSKLDALVMMAEMLYRQELRSEEKPQYSYAEENIRFDERLTSKPSRTVLNTNNFVGNFDHPHLSSSRGSFESSMVEYEQSLRPQQTRPVYG